MNDPWIVVMRCEGGAALRLAANVHADGDPTLGQLVGMEP